MTTESGADRAEHVEDWCDTNLHHIPVRPGCEDPGCHRLIEFGGMWWMIHRIGRHVVLSDDAGNVWPVEVARVAFTVGVGQLASIPRQRNA